MSVTFVPSDSFTDSLGTSAHILIYIKALIIDESGPGVEIRVMSDGEVMSSPLEKGVEHYRNSPLWTEVKG